MIKHALVFAGGAFSENTLLELPADVIEADIWCADSGVEHAISCGLWPKVIVGDSDSVSQSSLAKAIEHGAKIIEHPVNKNASDLELTLKELTDAEYTDITLLAASGGRTDHALFNWLLVLQQDWPCRFTVIDNTVSAYLVHSDVSFDAELLPGTTVSLISRESVSGVTTQGLKYPLTDARLMGGSTLGLSNEVSAVAELPTRVQVKVSSGRLLACVVHSAAIEI